MPWQTIARAKYGSGDYRACLDNGRRDNWLRRRAAPPGEARSDGRYVGGRLRLLRRDDRSTRLEEFLGKHTRSTVRTRSRHACDSRSGGSGALHRASPPIGQSTNTAFGQVAATVIGLDPAKVQGLRRPDTHGTPVTTGSFASGR
jgi:CO/xanthine dehydrogenase Mo-binding subunit